ncbi:MAG: cytochrome c biogenesis CcdA family protein [Alphaproteobacteria bacterium]
MAHNPLTALGITFIGGILASAVCPCTLPMGLGVAGMAGASQVSARYGGLQVSAAFFAGIVVSLTALGGVAGRLGALATESFGRHWALGMAVLSLLAAALALWWPRMPIDRLTAWRRPGVVGSFAYGIVFSLGTSVAPFLLLLTIAAAVGRPEQAILLALIFGLGRGLPFLLAGMAGSAVTGLTRLGLAGRAIQIASGVALLVVSVYYANVFVALL